MNILEMSKAPKNSDKLSLIKQEEEAFEEHHSKPETNSCGKRCRVLLFYAVLIGMLIILYYLILLGWQSYMKQYGSNETTPFFALYGIPLLHIDEIPDVNEDMPDISRNIDDINKRKRRSPTTIIGIQSHNDNVNKKEANHLLEEKILEFDTVSYKDNLQEDSSELEKLLEMIIASELMVSKTKPNSYASNQEIEQVIDHQIFEDEDKEIIQYKMFNQKDSSTINTEYSISDNHNNADNLHYKTTERKYMQNIYQLTGENENITVGEIIYYGILIVFGILLIIALCLCIKFFYDIISVRYSRKHTRLQEEQENEINNRLDPLNCKFPSTPVEKDLRFGMNREKMDMFCDLND